MPQIIRIKITMITNKHKVLTRVSFRHHSFTRASDRVWPQARAFLKNTRKVLGPENFAGRLL